jgi:hypothetical protein
VKTNVTTTTKKMITISNGYDHCCDGCGAVHGSTDTCVCDLMMCNGCAGADEICTCDE